MCEAWHLIKVEYLRRLKEGNVSPYAEDVSEFVEVVGRWSYSSAGSTTPKSASGHTVSALAIAVK